MSTQEIKRVPLFSALRDFVGARSKVLAKERAAKKKAADAALDEAVARLEAEHPPVLEDVPLAVRRLVADEFAPTPESPESSRRAAAHRRLISDPRMGPVWRALRTSREDQEAWNSAGESLLRLLDGLDWALASATVKSRKELDETDQSVRAAIHKLRRELPGSSARTIAPDLTPMLDEVLLQLDQGPPFPESHFPPQVRDRDGNLTEGAVRSVLAVALRDWMQENLGSPRNDFVADTIETWTEIKTDARYVLRAIQQMRGRTDSKVATSRAVRRKSPVSGSGRKT